MIIGLTGKNAAGKGETAQYLVTKGFAYYSLSDMLREICKKNNIEPSREALIEMGNKMRERHGPGFLAAEINHQITKDLSEKPEQDFVIDSIRSPFEVKELSENVDFFLICIDAPMEMRFERMRLRQRRGDAKSLQELSAQEKKENSNLSTGQQLDATIALATRTIRNVGTLSELYESIDSLLDELK